MDNLVPFAPIVFSANSLNGEEPKRSIAKDFPKNFKLVTKI